MQHTFMQPILAAKNAAAHKSPMSSKYRCCRRASASFQLPCGAPSSLSRIQTSLAIQQLLLQRYKSVTNGHMRKQPDALGRRIKANESCEPATNVPRTIAHVTNSGPVALFHPFRDDGALSARCFGEKSGRAHTHTHNTRCHLKCSGSHLAEVFGAGETTRRRLAPWSVRLHAQDAAGPSCGVRYDSREAMTDALRF